MAQFADHAFKIIIGLVVTGAVTYCVNKLKNISNMFTKQHDSIMAMNHDRLYQACTFYIMTNQITFAELSNLEHLYVPYAALGGNGTGKAMYEECQELPKVDKRTRWHEYYEAKDKG